MSDTKKEKIIGIDLGTSNSAASVLVGGKPTVVPSAEGAQRDQLHQVHDLDHRRQRHRPDRLQAARREHEVRAVRDRGRPDAGGVPLLPEVLRQGSGHRFREGLRGFASFPLIYLTKGGYPT